MTSTSCGFIQHGRVKSDHSGGQTYGGWSKKITAHRRFISLIPKSYPLEKAGPVFCGGITMFAPLFENGAFKGKVRCSNDNPTDSLTLWRRITVLHAY